MDRSRRLVACLGHCAVTLHARDNLKYARNVEPRGVVAVVKDARIGAVPVILQELKAAMSQLPSRTHGAAPPPPGS